VSHTAAVALGASAAAVAIAAFAWQCVTIGRLRRRAETAVRHFNMLQNLAPALTAASSESTFAACARILDRFASLVGAQTLLCFYEADDRLMLGAKSGAGYVGFLREGEPYAGGAIVEWARDRAAAAIVGPAASALPADLGISDMSRDPGTAGPVAGSRDRVWALALPLTRTRDYGLRPEVIGVLYAERNKAEPFSPGELSTALTVARLASDALSRAVFADRMRRESERDPLTQLLTPSKFRMRLRSEIEARRHPAGRASRDVGLLFIDTDNFKLWNDTHGHAAGDKLLRALADAFDDIAARGGGFAGRNGGDEFCVALLDRTKDASITLAEHLRNRIESLDFAKLFGIDALAPIKITVSVGVAHFPVDVAPSEPQPADRLFEAADANMYAAKRAGRNRVEWRRASSPRRLERIPGAGPIPRL